MKYPLDYPLRRTAAGANICRYHNYGQCLRAASGACECDHEHCHRCGEAGHRAVECEVDPALAWQRAAQRRRGEGASMGVHSVACEGDGG